MVYLVKETRYQDLKKEHNMAEEQNDVTVNDLVDNIIAGQNADAQDQFNALMQQRTGEALDNLKQQQAASTFGNQIAGKEGADIGEFEKMGLVPDQEPVGDSLEDAVVDVDTETGVPVDKQDNEEN